MAGGSCPSNSQPVANQGPYRRAHGLPQRPTDSHLPAHGERSNLASGRDRPFVPRSLPQTLCPATPQVAAMAVEGHFRAHLKPLPAGLSAPSAGPLQTQTGPPPAHSPHASASTSAGAARVAPMLQRRGYPSTRVDDGPSVHGGLFQDSTDAAPPSAASSAAARPAWCLHGRCRPAPASQASTSAPPRRPRRSAPRRARPRRCLDPTAAPPYRGGGGDRRRPGAPPCWQVGTDSSPILRLFDGQNGA